MERNEIAALVNRCEEAETRAAGGEDVKDERLKQLEGEKKTLKAELAEKLHVIDDLNFRLEVGGRRELRLLRKRRVSLLIEITKSSN